jgi:hypothetical protein
MLDRTLLAKIEEFQAYWSEFKAIHWAMLQTQGSELEKLQLALRDLHRPLLLLDKLLEQLHEYVTTYKAMRPTETEYLLCLAHDLAVYLRGVKGYREIFLNNEVEDEGDLLKCQKSLINYLVETDNVVASLSDIPAE